MELSAYYAALLCKELNYRHLAVSEPVELCRFLANAYWRLVPGLASLIGVLCHLRSKNREAISVARTAKPSTKLMENEIICELCRWACPRTA